MKPNLFNIGTKELAQDAFLTWLIEWAAPENKKYDKELHQCGQDFVKFLIQEIDYNKPITSVKTKRQWNHIDIKVEINDEILFIIEDKTFTKRRKDQLKTYKKTAVDYWKAKPDAPVCIYLKTGSESKLSLDKIREEEKYTVFNRTHLINFFNTYTNITNNIFLDFKDRINQLEEKEQGFLSKSIGEWAEDNNCWMGFCRYLEKNLENGDWGIINPPSGKSFFGFWWNVQRWNNYWVKLQIEKGDLCFKLNEVNNSKVQKEVRTELFNLVKKQKNASNDKDIEHVTKPAQFGKGKNMTVVIVPKAKWMGNDGETLNEETMLQLIDKLKKYQSFFNECLNDVN